MRAEQVRAWASLAAVLVWASLTAWFWTVTL